MYDICILYVVLLGLFWDVERCVMDVCKIKGKREGPEWSECQVDGGIHMMIYRLNTSTLRGRED